MAISNYKNMKAPSTCAQVICLAINRREKEVVWGGKVGCSSGLNYRDGAHTPGKPGSWGCHGDGSAGTHVRQQFE